MPQAPGRSARLLAGLLLIVGFALFVLAFRSQVERNPLRADEVDFYRCMRSVVDLGRPLYYAGEIRLQAENVQPLGTDTFQGRVFNFYRFTPQTRVLKETFFAVTGDSSRYTYCLWHPPLYIYLGSLFVRLFDLPTAQAALFRYAHLVLVALMFVGLALYMHELYGRAWLLGLALAALFLACSELAVSASALIDYNGALAMCAATWLGWAFVRSDRDAQGLPVFAVLLALTFWVGLGVGAALVLGLLLWTSSFRPQALVRNGLATLAGLALFLVSLLLASRVGHFPFSQPFLHNLQRAAVQTPLQTRVVSLLHYTSWYVSEIGLVAVVIALLLVACRLIRGREQSIQTRSLAQRRLLAPALVLVALLSQAMLAADAWGFPKYIAFALPLLYGFLGGEIAMQIDAVRTRWLAVALALALLVTSVFQSAQALGKPGSTLYGAGDQGFLDAAEVLAENSRPDDVFLGAKDLSFYAGRSFIQWSGSLLTDLALLQSRMTENQVRLVATSEGQLGAASTEVREWLLGHADLIAAPGDHRLYRLR